MQAEGNRGGGDCLRHCKSPGEYQVPLSMLATISGAVASVCLCVEAEQKICVCRLKVIEVVVIAFDIARAQESIQYRSLHGLLLALVQSHLCVSAFKLSQRSVRAV